MNATIRLSLVAIAVLVAHTHAQQQCTPANGGTVTPNVNQLPKQTLAPGEASFDITIGNPCDGAPAGVFLSVCDTDVQPTVSLQPSLLEAYVHRNGQLLGTGTVNGQIYCY